MSGRLGDALPTRATVGDVVKPCGMLKVFLEPSPVKRICPPFFSRGVLWSSWSRASTTRFHSSGVRIYGKGRQLYLPLLPLLYMLDSICSWVCRLIWLVLRVVWVLRLR